MTEEASKRSEYSSEQWEELSFEKKVEVLRDDFKNDFRVVVKTGNTEEFEIALAPVEVVDISRELYLNIIDQPMSEIKKLLENPNTKASALVKAVFGVTL